MAYFPLGGPTVSSNMLIGILFHAKTLKRHKERVSDSQFEEQGVCRVVFASTALGMGVNHPPGDTLWSTSRSRGLCPGNWKGRM